VFYLTHTWNMCTDTTYALSKYDYQGSHKGHERHERHGMDAKYGATNLTG
jgi:hypothetical protein